MYISHNLHWASKTKTLGVVEPIFILDLHICLVFLDTITNIY